MTKDEKIDKIKKGKPFRILDIVFFALILAVLGIVLYFTFRPRISPSDLYAEVRIDGKIYASYPLNKTASYDIDGKLTLKIEAHSAYVTGSVCPDGVCEHMGRINKVHEMIVCAPEGITVRITGSAFLLPGVG